MRPMEKTQHRGHQVLGWLTWLGRHEFPVLLCLVVVSGGLWLFAELADDVMEHETRSFDEALMLSLRSPTDHSDPLGPGWVEEMGRDFTALGSVGVLVLVTVGALGYLLLSRQFRTALFTLVVVSGGWLLMTVMKSGYGRLRPDLVPHDMTVYSASFPSGHAMMSAVTYLTLAAMLSRVEAKWRLKAYFLLMAVCFTVLVGISRVYLGVHWPTDVAAGWTVGGAWAAGCWLVAQWMQRRGILKPAQD
jgi:undecaprenyl-diphosphatase